MWRMLWRRYKMRGRFMINGYGLQRRMPYPLGIKSSTTKLPAYYWFRRAWLARSLPNHEPHDVHWLSKSKVERGYDLSPRLHKLKRRDELVASISTRLHSTNAPWIKHQILTTAIVTPGNWQMNARFTKPIPYYRWIALITRSR